MVWPVVVGKMVGAGGSSKLDREVSSVVLGWGVVEGGGSKWKI